LFSVTLFSNTGVGQELLSSSCGVDKVTGEVESVPVRA
jgi:hypothetical protein